MKPSKLILLPLSAAFVFGCNDSDSGSSSGGSSEPEITIEDTYWEMSGTGLSTRSLYSGDIYFFSDDTLTIYFSEDGGTSYEYITTDYTATETTVEFEDTDGDTIDATYTVTDGALELSYTLDSTDYVVDGTEETDTTLLDAADLYVPEALSEYTFTNFSESDDPLVADEGTAGSIGDITSISENSAVADAVLTAAAGVAGDADTALDLEQGDTTSPTYGYISYTADGSSAADQLTGSFTLEAVVYSESARTDDVSIIDFADSNTNSGFKLFVEADDQTIRFRIYGDSDSYTVQGSALSTETWYHIAAVYDDESSLLSIYIDGTLVASDTADIAYFPNAHSTGDKFAIGGSSTSSDKNFDGIIDNIAVWDETLSADQIETRAEMFAEEGDVVETSGNSVLLDDNDGVDTGELRLDLDSSYAEGQVSVNLMYAADETETAYLGLYGSSTSSSDAIAELKIDSGYQLTSGNVGIRLRDADSSDDVSITEFAAATWANVVVTWDANASTYTVTVDGSEIGTYTMYNSGNVEKVIFKLASSSKVAESDTPVYIDDLMVYSDTSGTTSIHSDDFDDYTVGISLSGVGDYHSNTFEATVSDAQDATNQ